MGEFGDRPPGELPDHQQAALQLLELGLEAGDLLGLLLDQLLLDGGELGQLLIGRRTGLLGTLGHACKSSNIRVISRTRWSTTCDGPAGGLNSYEEIGTCGILET